MRIIAGSRARTNILPPRDLTTRPITDRVKESLFSIINDRLANARVADLFCGTGSMGLEAISRGAAHAIMVDKDRDAIARLHKNIAKLRFEHQTTVRCADIFRCGIPISPAVDTATKQVSNNEIPVVATEDKRCDLVFVDPPYRLSLETAPESKLALLLCKIAEQVAPRAMVIVRQQKQAQGLADQYASLCLTQTRQYGSMILSFLENVL
ncbi:MAG: 16S rRNA (guanine(966)-N(2))-methyltransferase RsmD [Sedimentisphaerales bacterium]|nr:16S rRNA (guanine(966)-N(2))-methyltransferase RsmD [Sedimentisphaerales bacterium]